MNCNYQESTLKLCKHQIPVKFGCKICNEESNNECRHGNWKSRMEKRISELEGLGKALRDKYNSLCSPSIMANLPESKNNQQIHICPQCSGTGNSMDQIFRIGVRINTKTGLIVCEDCSGAGNIWK